MSAARHPEPPSASTIAGSPQCGGPAELLLHGPPSVERFAHSTKSRQPPHPRPRRPPEAVAASLRAASKRSLALLCCRVFAQCRRSSLSFQSNLEQLNLNQIDPLRIVG